MNAQNGGCGTCLPLAQSETLTFTGTRLETHVTGCIPALAKTVWIFQRQHVREGDQRSHSLDLLQPLCFWISVPCHGLEHLIVLADPFADRLYLSHHRFQCTLQLRTQILRRLRLHPPCVASAEPLTVRLRQAARPVDQHHPFAGRCRSRPPI